MWRFVSASAIRELQAVGPNTQSPPSSHLPFWMLSCDPSSVLGGPTLDLGASTVANAVRQRLGRLFPCALQSQIGDGNKPVLDGQTQSPSVFSLVRICQVSPCFFQMHQYSVWQGREYAERGSVKLPVSLLTLWSLVNVFGERDTDSKPTLMVGEQAQGGEELWSEEVDPSSAHWLTGAESG